VALGGRGAEAQGKGAGPVESVPAGFGARRGLTNLEYAPLCEIMGRVMWSPEVFKLLGAGHRQHGSAGALRTAEQQSNGCAAAGGRTRSCFAMTEPAVASSGCHQHPRRPSFATAITMS